MWKILMQLHLTLYIKEEIKLKEKSWLTTLGKTYYGKLKNYTYFKWAKLFCKKCWWLRKLTNEMNTFWAKIGRGNELSLCTKMWVCAKKAGKFIAKKLIQDLIYKKHGPGWVPIQHVWFGAVYSCSNRSASKQSLYYLQFLMVINSHSCIVLIRTQWRPWTYTRK